MGRKYGMPAPRSIYPQMLESEQIRELAKNKDHLLVWYGLFAGVDDQGRMEARVSTIQANCLSHLPENAIKPRAIQEALHRMCQLRDEDDVPLVYIYDANGTKVLQIAKWWAYQGYMRNAWPSRWDPMPGWADEFRGHGLTAYKKMLAEQAAKGNSGAPTGAPAGAPTGAPTVRPIYPHPLVSNETDKKPWDLFAAFLEERGLTASDFPGARIQLSHAKQMLAEGWTPEMIREATRVFSRDDFWNGKGFDLSSIRAHWGKMKNRGRGSPTSPKVQNIKNYTDPYMPKLSSAVASE